MTATAVMKGVRILEVAEHTFVPAASALLADWGAEVIKIEPTERGDAMRGLASTGVLSLGGDVHPLLEHSNRGKRSLALDLTTPDGVEILYKLAATADVFLTNKLPRVRRKLSIELEDIRAHNPNIIYVAGTGQGERGPDADKGSYDALSFWYRPGVSLGVKPADSDQIPGPPGPGFGDSIGAMTIAGGIMGALYHRERTGEATTVDVSLLSTGIWAMGQAYALSLLTGMPWQGAPSDAPRLNPLVRNFLTKDGHALAFCCLQASRYWAELCTAVGRPELGTDARFADHAGLLEHSTEAQELLETAFAEHTVAEWRDLLDEFTGQWCVVQDTLEGATIDPQTEANGYIQDCITASGTPFKMVAAPVQFGGAPAAALRAPEFNEHGDDILGELGIDWDTVVDLKVRSVVG
ncbi:MAG TPA: CoA transferase [Acidimicrobiales bacterium]|jgi:crotonobetainyl-CoA:carnitine CoA-transferase CaiB-like acyl-CoA transferase